MSKSRSRAGAMPKAAQWSLGVTRRLWRNDQVLLGILAAVLGIAAAYGAIAFRDLVSMVQWAALSTPSEDLLKFMVRVEWWQIVLAPTLGGLAVGLIVRFFTAEQRPLAVAEVIEAAALKSGRMDLSSGLKAAVVSAISIGSGASVGREGPVVHLGASLAAFVADKLNLTRGRALTLLGCGVAAAVAASFNAPIAGVFFALEVVVGHYALSAFAPIVIASVVGTVISRAHYGDFPAFIVSQHVVASPWEFALFAALGVASAGTAYLFMRSIFAMHDVAGKLPGPVWLRPALAGLVIGLLALVFPQILGVGYGVTDQALKGALGLELLLALVVLKIFATALCLGFGFGGGVFSPSLVVGAMLGGAFGSAAALVTPDNLSSPGVYSMVGMGAVAGAVLGAPISTILIVFELTGDYKVTIAVMIAVVFASIIVRDVLGRSYFTWQLERRGVDLSGGRENIHLKAIKVGRVMESRITTLDASATLTELRRRIVRAPSGVVFVTDAEGRLEGMITMADLSEALFDLSLDKFVSAGEMARPPHDFVEAGISLDRAVAAFGAAAKEPFLPVVESRRTMKLVGILTEREVMLAQQRALLKARAEEKGEE
ncbi:MAG: chloride channel protein [Alphaproteobacteria bacterium]